ncbi:MFS transporter [Brevibacillus nitrificans]|uniref:MFS transporter n=1 Tax=Brevibacillus nitrificans TaxID=651560 RepID=UPI002E1A4B32|nr:MFS transporter [Brevibacillus nitrificans]
MEEMKAHTSSKITKSGWATIGFLFFLAIINVADKSIIGLASVPIMKELGLTPAQWGLVGSAFFWFFSLSAILVGALSDYVGTKKVIAVISSIWAVVQFATVFVASFPFLLVTRIILGAGEGPTYGLSMAMASKCLPKDKIGTGLTLVSVGNTVGAAVAAPVLLFFITSYSWHVAFIFMGAIGVVWTLLWIFFAKDRPSVAEAEVAAPKPDKAKSVPWSEFLPLLLSKNFLLISLCAFASYWFFSLELSWFPNYFEKVRGMDGNMLKIAIMLPWITTTISQLFFSNISDRLYQKTRNVVKSRVLIVGPMVVIAAISYYLTTIVSSNTAAVALLCLATAFRSIILVLGPAILTDTFAPKHYGKAQGSFTAIYYLAGIIAPFVTGLIVQNAASPAEGFHRAFHVGSVIMIVLGLLFWFGVRPKKNSSSLFTNVNNDI